MSYQFILGGTGTGKTEYMIQKMTQEKVPAIYIVPEQYTLQAQEDVIKGTPEKGILDIEVLSFNRLVYRYFDELGLAGTVTLRETGKSMLIRKVLEKKVDEFVWIQKHRKKQGYMEELNQLLKECYQYNIDDHMLEEYIQKIPRGLLQDKLKDLKIILEEFNNVMEEGYLTSERATRGLIDRIADIPSLRETTIYIDGFYGFTPLQYAFIEELMVYCKKVVCAVTISKKTSLENMKNEGEIYYESKKMVSCLREIGDRVGIGEEESIWKEKIYRTINKDLQHLNQYLYQYPVQVFNEESHRIRLMEGATIEEEVEAIVCRIHQLVTEKNVRYRDIVLLASDLELYKTKIKEGFQTYELPVFLDRKETIASHPLVQFILSAIRSVQYNFKYEHVFYHLKSLYYNVEEEHVYQLENYAIAHGIQRKSQWLKDWGDYEEIKNQCMDVFFYFAENLKKGKTVRQRTKALYMYLKSQNIYEKTMEMMALFEEKEELQRGDSYPRIYQLIIEMLDEMVGLIGEEKISIQDYVSLIETGLMQIKMGQTPPSVDQIIVGDLSRTRFREVDYVFILGVNEGKVPLVQSASQLLTNDERSTLLDLGLEFAPNQKKSLFKEQMNIYMGLTRSRKLLHVSYGRRLEEKAERPATLFLLLRKMFPKVAVERGSVIIKKYKKPSRYYAMLHRFVRLSGEKEFRKNEEEIQKLYIFFNKAYNEGKGIDPGQFIKGIDYNNQPVQLEPMSESIQSSISQFESYAGCSYRYFLTYRLGIRERGEYMISMPDIGILFHRCLELYMKKCLLRQMDIDAVPVPVRNQLIEEVIQEVLDMEHLTIFTSSHRYRYLIVKLTRILKRALWGIEEQLKRSKFKPKEAEYMFNGRDYPIDSLRLPMANKHHVYLTGVVDRVDEYETEDALYFSIVDYKSGSKDIDFNLVQEGIQMQLILYTHVIEEIKAYKQNKKVVPCGMYYYKIQDPLLQIKEKAPKDLEEERLKKLKLRGLLLHDPEILGYFDEHIEQVSLVVPAALTKSGSIAKTSSTVDTEQMATLKKYVQQKAQKIATHIFEGDLSIEPYRYKEETGCDYCLYKSICRFDPTNDLEEFRQIKPKDKENIFEAMKGVCHGRRHQENHRD